MRSSFSLVATVLMVFAASGLHAQCAFDAPAKAKGLKSDMIRAYSSCPGVTFAAPNTSTMAGVPACGVPVAMSTYEFGPKGQCRIRTRQSVTDKCPGFPITGPVPCADIRIGVKCSDIREPGGDAIADGSVWALQILNRFTFADPFNGDMTVIDYPAQFSFDPAKNGGLRLKYSTADPPWNVLLEQPPGIPACSALEVLAVAIHDPDGNIFATLGSSTR